MKKSAVVMMMFMVFAAVVNAGEMVPAAVDAGTGVTANTQMAKDDIQKAVEAYFTSVFGRLKEVADKKPAVDTFRDAMKPLVDKTDGLYGATFIDTNFIIRQVYSPSQFLARGFDLKKVKQLDYFWEQMRKAPEPQVSEPGHGSLVQPRLIAMRYPVITDGKLQSVVSIMVRTEVFLAAAGLDKCKGYRITCRGVMAEESGDLTGKLVSFESKLPCNDWKVEYKK